MALSDLLWACPACGRDRGLAGGARACSACGTRFLRGVDATIRAVAPDGTETVHTAAEWLEHLPYPASLLEDDPVRSARVLIRAVTGEAAVTGEGGYLNRIELFGDEVPGTVRLEPERLVVEWDEDSHFGRGHGQSARRCENWPLESLTAVQTSSTSLQLKRRGEPLVAFRFQNDSLYLWEQLLRAALRRFYGKTGRGAIREFQPRIVTD